MILLASAGSKEGIIECISKFYYSSNISLRPLTDSIYMIFNLKGKVKGVHVIKKKNRYRFEGE